jgi:ABC-2 type transport system permease protein
VIKLLNLVLNENMKIYRRIRTWIMVGLLVIITVVTSIVIFNFQPKDNTNWQEKTKINITKSEAALKNASILSKDIENSIKVDQYSLDHNIQPSLNTTWGLVKALSAIMLVVIILTCIEASDSVAGEFSSGTIKLLLIRPVTRAKILLSKYISSFLFALLLLAVLFATAFISSSFLYGFNDIGLPYLHVGSNGNVEESPIIIHVLQTYGLNCVNLIMSVTIAFMISTVFRSSALAISTSIVFLLLGTSLTQLLTQYSWAKYILFANTDLTQHIEGRPFFAGMTMSFSLIVLLVYFVIFNTLSWGIFKKRDVAA